MVASRGVGAHKVVARAAACISITMSSPDPLQWYVRNFHDVLLHEYESEGELYDKIDDADYMRSRGVKWIGAKVGDFVENFRVFVPLDIDVPVRVAYLVARSDMAECPCARAAGLCRLHTATPRVVRVFSRVAETSLLVACPHPVGNYLFFEPPGPPPSAV